MVNSIKDHMTQEDTISEIRLMLGHNKQRVCVVVEGEDDQKIFGHLLTGNVDLFVSYAPKRGIEEIVTQHFPREKRVIGIRDKDYCQRAISKRVFFCDYCCLEMMIISNDSCFERLYCDYYRGQASAQELRIHCLKHLECLSKIRLFNERNRWNLRLSGINPGGLYKKSETEMEELILSEINTQNLSNIMDEERVLEYKSLPVCSALKEYLEITNGHDFVHLFSKVCPSHPSIKAISSTMRGTFGQYEFSHTQLYSNLHTYQEQKGITIVS